MEKAIVLDAVHTGKFNKDNGITLIALIITIIVLLILAGVNIVTLTGENGLLSKSETAKTEAKIKEIEEQIELAVTYSMINDNIKIDEELLNKELKNNLGQDVAIEMNGTDNGLPWIVTKDGFEFLIKENGEVTQEAIKVISDESLIEEVSKIDTSGVKNIQVNGVTYSANVIIKQGNLILDGSHVEDATLTQVQETIDEQTVTKSIYEFGNKETDVATETEDAKNMVVLKVDGDIIINENVIMTACKSDDGYGGPKGLFVYCTGTITNNGKISMTARGARAQGQDVYLWRNADGSYEYIPKDGGLGGEGQTLNTQTTNNGINGYNGSTRQTGGGGSGAISRWASGTAVTGSGAQGTSYSGGTGGGASCARDIKITSESGAAFGGKRTETQHLVHILIQQDIMEEAELEIQEGIIKHMVQKVVMVQEDY